MAEEKVQVTHSDIHRDIGYLTKAIEDMTNSFEAYTRKSEHQYSHVDARLDKIEARLSFYKTVARTLKFVAIAIALIATLQWDNLSVAWSDLLKFLK